MGAQGVMSNSCDHFVYWLHNADGDCVYVGSTEDPERRWKEHYRRIGSEISVARVDGPYPRGTARDYELSEIKRLAPKYNGQLNTVPRAVSSWSGWVDCPDKDILWRASELLAEKAIAKYQAKQAAS